MIRISKKADYAIVLMTYLARQAAREGGSEIPISAQELANAIPLGKPTIANLLKALTRAEVLTSIRGVHGGYRLARPAEKINVAQILEAVEGPLEIVECVNYENVEDAACELSSCCTSHHPLQLLQRRIAALLESTNLSEFVHSCPLPNLLQDIR